MPTTPSLQPLRIPTLPPFLGQVLTGLFPRQLFLPFQQNSRLDNLSGLLQTPQYSLGPRTCLVGVSIWRRQIVGVAGVRVLGLIYQLVRWPVHMVETLTIDLKGKLLLLLPPICTLCSEANLETIFSFPLFQRNTSLLPCSCMNE